MKEPLNKAFFSKNSSLQVRRLFSKSGRKRFPSLDSITNYQLEKLCEIKNFFPQFHNHPSKTLLYRYIERKITNLEKFFVKCS